jgi:MFS family permease
MTTTAARARPSLFAVFRNRDFTWIWTGQLVSTIGSSLTQIAAAILIFRVTGSALSVGLMLMATAAPSLLLGLIAGVFVDRMDRKRIMVGVDLVRAFLVVLIPFVVQVDIAWLYVLIALTSAVGQFFEPAHASVLPEVASEEELAAANSFIAISSFGSTAIGFAASGLIASRFPIEWAFYLDGLSFLASALCIAMVRISPLPVEGKTSISIVLRNLREGADFLWNKPILRSLLIVNIPLLLGFGLWNVLLLPFAERALGATEFEYGLQEGLTSVGFVIASFLMARWADRLREGQWIAISYIGMGLIAALYSRTASIPLAILLVMITGFLNAPSAIARKLAFQRNAPREIRGRAFSAFFVTRDVVLLLGMAAAGLADLIDIRLLMLVSGALVLAAGGIALVIPGLGQPAEEWRRAVARLRAAPAEPGLSILRPAALSDFDRLTGHLPVLSRLGEVDREGFLAGADLAEAPQGATIIRHGEAGDEAFFILAGRAVAGLETPGGGYRALSAMEAGDFFGEIGALLDMPRTADVVADEDIEVLRVPGRNLDVLLEDPRLRYLILSKLTERVDRTHIADLPRLARLDPEALRDLRRPDRQRAIQAA